MGWFDWVVLGIIALCAWIGYRRGFLRVVYSLFAWMLMLAFVIWATPHLAEFLEENTGLKAAVQEKCADYLESLAEEKLAEGVEEYGKNQQEAQFFLPEGIIEEIMGAASGSVGEILEDSGIYEEISASAAHFVIEGIAFFAAMTAAGILLRMLLYFLNEASHLPVLEDANQLLGAAAGAAKGLLIVWLIFFVITVGAPWGVTAPLLEEIEKSMLLHFLYENNLLMKGIFFAIGKLKMG